MMLLWVDGFDHYGTTASRLLDGPYASIGETNNMTLVTTQFRTGTHSLRNDGFGSLFAGSDNTPIRGIRRGFGGTKTRVGVGYASYLESLPSSSNMLALFVFCDSLGSRQLTIFCTSTGTVQVRLGDFTGSVIGTSVTQMTANAWNHLEVAVTISDTVGSVEFKLNGVTILHLTNIDTQGTTRVGTDSVRMETVGNVISPVRYIDDLFAWDDTGTYNNTFIGDRKVLTLHPSSDEVVSDWDPLTGSDGYAMVDEANPDEDTTYISTPTSSFPVVSEFGLDDLDPEISSVAALYTVCRIKRTDTGLCLIQQSMVLGAGEALGVERPITELYTYWADMFETNPSTGLPWTRSAVNAARFRITKTA